MIDVTVNEEEAKQKFHAKKANLYSVESADDKRKELEAGITEYDKRSELENQDERDAAEFIRRLRKYSNAEELTREMCLELIEYVTVDENNKSDKDHPREIHIYYKLLDTKLNDKRNALI